MLRTELETPQTPREWAELIADQFCVTDPGAIDAIEEGVHRGASIAQGLRKAARVIAERLSIEAQIAAPIISEEGRLRAKMGDCATSLFAAVKAASK